MLAWWFATLPAWAAVTVASLAAFGGGIIVALALAGGWWVWRRLARGWARSRRLAELAAPAENAGYEISAGRWRALTEQARSEIR